MDPNGGVISKEASFSILPLLTTFIFNILFVLPITVSHLPITIIFAISVSLGGGLTTIVMSFSLIDVYFNLIVCFLVIWMVCILYASVCPFCGWLAAKLVMCPLQNEIKKIYFFSPKLFYLVFGKFFWILFWCLDGCYKSEKDSYDLYYSHTFKMRFGCR